MTASSKYTQSIFNHKMTSCLKLVIVTFRDKRFHLLCQYFTPFVIMEQPFVVVVLIADVVVVVVIPLVMPFAFVVIPFKWYPFVVLVE